MNMDTKSKNVCLIGVLHILGYMLFSYDPLMKGLAMINSKENDEVSFVYLIVVAIYVFLSLLAGLMIYGVVKQRYLLVAPFLVISLVALMVLVIIFLLQEYIYFYHFKSALYTIGVQIMMLYPIYSLYLKLSTKSLKVNTYCEQDQKIDELMTQT